MGGADTDGRRAVTIYSRPEDVLDGGLQPGEDGWLRHATGVLAADGEDWLASEKSVHERALALGEVWPPADAVPLDVEELYDRLAAAGLEYGPAFQGMQGVWRRGEELFVELERSAAESELGAGAFGLHPALLEAALQPLAATSDVGGAWQPLTWRGVRLFAVAATRLRVVLSLRGEGEGNGESENDNAPAAALVAADEAGGLVLAVASVTLGELRDSRAKAPGDHLAESLFELVWMPAGPAMATRNAAGSDTVTDRSTGIGWPRDAVVVGAGEDDLAAALCVNDHELIADVLYVDCLCDEDVDCLYDEDDHNDADADSEARPDAGSQATAQSAHAQVNRALKLIQAWLEDARYAGSHLVFVTRGAVAARPGEHLTGLAAAGVWGLVRSAQWEHPGRLTLVDVDGTEASWAALPAAVANREEPQLAIRDGEPLAVRLVRAREDRELTPPVAGDGWRLDATGGTLEGLALVESEEALRPLQPHEVRVAVRAGGVNFRDVLVALGMYPGRAQLGGEGAGVVVEVGAEVEDLTPGIA